jgi:hypothetical protein
MYPAHIQAHAALPVLWYQTEDNYTISFGLGSKDPAPKFWDKWFFETISTAQSHPSW